VIRYTVSLACFLAAFSAALVLFNRPVSPNGAIAILLASSPALGLIGAFGAIGRLIVDIRDEYQRMLFVKQILIATVITLSVATIWGFLERFGQAPRVPAFSIAILWFAMLGIGGAIARFRA
jgi:hypothetical protein